MPAKAYPDTIREHSGGEDTPANTPSSSFRMRNRTLLTSGQTKERTEVLKARLYEIAHWTAAGDIEHTPHSFSVSGGNLCKTGTSLYGFQKYP